MSVNNVMMSVLPWSLLGRMVHAPRKAQLGVYVSLLSYHTDKGQGGISFETKRNFLVAANARSCLTRRKAKGTEVIHFDRLLRLIPLLLLLPRSWTVGFLWGRKWPESYGRGVGRAGHEETETDHSGDSCCQRCPAKLLYSVCSGLLPSLAQACAQVLLRLLALSLSLLLGPGPGGAVLFFSWTGCVDNAHHCRIGRWGCVGLTRGAAHHRRKRDPELPCLPEAWERSGVCPRSAA